MAASPTPASESGKLFVGGTIAVIWTAGLLVAVAINVAVVSTALSVVLSIVSIAIPVLTILGVKVLKRPVIDPNAVPALIRVVIATDLAVTMIWAGWAVHQASRDVDILSRINLTGQTNVLPGGTAALDVPLPAERDNAVLVFRVSDHFPDIGTCASFVVLTVTPRAGGNAAPPVTQAPGQPVRVAVPPGSTRLHLDITLENHRDDPNCGVDLAVDSAVLTNSG
ncbi:hypothetical protein ABZ897_27900 [Nonomuraea sp. NPDC046802]|uniref:hypothetical protein n=1 Tax=Nonomuraea sp. NPDC046802 TaxID=3154919 RepID=UPI0033C2D71F